jgi:ribosome recycling factor
LKLKVKCQKRYIEPFYENLKEMRNKLSEKLEETIADEKTSEELKQWNEEQLEHLFTKFECEVFMKINFRSIRMKTMSMPSSECLKRFKTS